MRSKIWSRSRPVFLIFWKIDQRCLARPEICALISASASTVRSLPQTSSMYAWRDSAVSAMRPESVRNSSGSR